MSNKSALRVKERLNCGQLVRWHANGTVRRLWPMQTMQTQLAVRIYCIWSSWFQELCLFTSWSGRGLMERSSPSSGWKFALLSAVRFWGQLCLVKYKAPIDWRHMGGTEWVASLVLFTFSLADARSSYISSRIRPIRLLSSLHLTFTLLPV